MVIKTLHQEEQYDRQKGEHYTNFKARVSNLFKLSTL